MLYHLPDEVLHLIGQFLINTDQELLESLYEGHIQTIHHEQYPFRYLVKHSITACHFYFFQLGTLNREFHQRIKHNSYFWKKNLFYLDQLTVNQLGWNSTSSCLEDLYEEEYDEELDEIVLVPIKEKEPAKVINYEQISEAIDVCEMSRLFLKVDSNLIRAMTDRGSSVYHVRELIIDYNMADLSLVFDLIVHQCPFIEKVRIVTDSLGLNNPTQYIEPRITKETNCPLKQLRIINEQSANMKDSLCKKFGLIMEKYLPSFKNLEEIVLPFWSPTILTSISMSCKGLKKLALLGEMASGTYNQSFESIFDNIDSLESFIISKSLVKGFYTDIGQSHFMRILTKYSKTLKEFVVGTNLSRFSSSCLEESVQFEEELAANMPTKLETLIIENITDHYYNSSTPLAFINILTTLLNRKTNNFQFKLKNLIIDLNNFSLDNLNSISMKDIQNLFLKLSNSEEILLELSKQECASSIETLTFDFNFIDLSGVSVMLKSPFFSKLKSFILVNNGRELVNITPVATIPNLKSFKIMSHFNLHYESFYKDNIPMRSNTSDKGSCYLFDGSQSLEEIDATFEEELDLFKSNIFPNIKSITFDMKHYYSDILSVLSPLTRNFSKLERFDLCVRSDGYMDCTVAEKLRIMKNIKYASLTIDNNHFYAGLELLVLFFIITFGALVSDFKCRLLEPEEDLISLFDRVFYDFISEEDFCFYDEVKQSFNKKVVPYLKFEKSSTEDEFKD